MKTHFLPFLAAVILVSGCSFIPIKSTPAEKYNLLAAQGLEKQNSLFFGDAFQPFSKIVKPYGSNWLIKNPDQKSVFFIVTLGVNLNPDNIYEMKIRYSGTEGARILVTGSETGKEENIRGHIILNTNSYQNVNGMTTCSKEFTVTKDCKLLYPSLSIINPGKKGPAIQLLVEEFFIQKTGTMKKASPELKKINFASHYDFSKLPEGSFNNICKGLGEKAKKWSNIKAEIVKLNGEKVLHIVRKPENYIYPYMELKKFPVDPKYYHVKYTFKAKGTGSIKPGLWWKRPSLNWDYYHGKEVQLTDQWQTITVNHPCMTSDVKSATISFSSSGNGEFWIKDLSVTLE